MKDPEAIFRQVSDSPDLEAAVKGLNEFELTRLGIWLQAGHGEGVQGLVLALVQLEAAQRFFDAHC
jgi:hypothetical protein